MDTLELRKKHGGFVKIYLDKTKKIEAPKYFYKILMHKKSDSAIVFVTVNNPYIEDAAKEICTNVCKESGFLHDNFPDVTKGYTFCCELNEFKKLVPSLPEEVKGNNLLKPAKAQQSCSIKLPGDVNGFGPVILTSTSGNDYKLFKPTGQVTKLNEGTSLLLACTGQRNVLKKPKQVTLELKCSKGKFVDSKKKVHKLSKLICKSIPKSSLQKTDVQCSNGHGYIYETGFIINDKFYGPVFEICYSNTTENTFYTHHKLNGAAIKYAIPESKRRKFTAKGTTYGNAQIDGFYKKESQVALFKKYFGARQTYVNTKNKFLARGHLAPDADFIFGYEQLATFYFANVAPEFQVVNGGNWLTVEKLGRAIAAAFKEDIDSYNSYMDTLELRKKHGGFVKIYLDKTKKIEAPKYFYKILMHKKSDSAIVFVTVNNPYIEDAAKEICTNVCKESGILHANFPDVTKGYTFCCELNEFKKLVPSLPEEKTAT
ncbi:salivary protein Tsal1-like [Cochliomyia hominivorax]